LEYGTIRGSADATMPRKSGRGASVRSAQNEAGERRVPVCPIGSRASRSAASAAGRSATVPMAIVMATGSTRATPLTTGTRGDFHWRTNTLRNSVAPVERGNWATSPCREAAEHGAVCGRPRWEPSRLREINLPEAKTATVGTCRMVEPDPRHQVRREGCDSVPQCECYSRYDRQGSGPSIEVLEDPLQDRFAKQLSQALSNEFNGKIYLADVPRREPAHTDQFHTRALSA